MITQEQLKEAIERRDALQRYLDIDNKKIQIEEEELRTQIGRASCRERVSCAV